MAILLTANCHRLGAVPWCVLPSVSGSKTEHKYDQRITQFFKAPLALPGGVRQFQSIINKYVICVLSLCNVYSD